MLQCLGVLTYNMPQTKRYDPPGSAELSLASVDLIFLTFWIHCFLHSELEFVLLCSGSVRYQQIQFNNNASLRVSTFTKWQGILNNMCYCCPVEKNKETVWEWIALTAVFLNCLYLHCVLFSSTHNKLLFFSQVTTVRWIFAIMAQHAWQGWGTIHSSVSVQMATGETPATWQRQVHHRGNFFGVLEKSLFIYHTYRAINHAAYILLTLLPVALFSGPCSPNPCKNDGLCEVVTPTRRGDVFNEYICKCQPGFEGVHCQISKLLLDEQLRGNIKECVN